MNERKKNETEVSALDIKYILDVNQKAIEIYASIGKQYDEIIDQIEALKEISLKYEDDLERITDHNEELIRKNIELIEKTKSIIMVLEKIHELGKESKEISSKLEQEFESDIKKKLDEVDKNLFRLVIIFSSGLIGGLATITITLIQFFFSKK